MKEKFTANHNESPGVDVFDAFDELTRVNDSIEGAGNAITQLTAQFSRGEISTQQYNEARQVAFNNLEYFTVRKAALESKINATGTSRARSLAQRALGLFRY